MADRSLEYRPYLDGLRGIAVLLVFVFHAAQPGLPGGFIGVDIFFVLSGYLITRILVSQHARNGRIRVMDFYARRVRRLMPAVVVVVLVVVMREALWGSVLELGSRLRDALATLFYFENWNLVASADQYFAESVSASPLRHAWSLSIEEQFYVIWPLILIGVLAWSRAKPRRASLVVGGLAVLSVVAMALVFDPASPSRAYYGTDTRVHQPLIGALLALLVVRQRDPARRSVDPRIWPALAVASLIALLVAARVLSGGSPAYYRGGSLLVAVLTAVLIASLERAPEAWPSRSLGWAPFRELGRISYGFYLWHWPIILWLAIPEGFSFWERRVVNLAQFGLTLAISIASFMLIENPVREGTVRLGRLRSRSTIAFGLATLVAAGVFSVAVLDVPDVDPVVAVEETGPTASPADSPEGSAIDYTALAAAALADRSYEPCPDNPRPCVKVEGASDSAPTVALIGDSTAQSYDPALKLLAQEYGFRYVQAAVGGCPISHRLIATGQDGELHKPSNFLCYEEIPGIYETLLTEYRPDLIIATSWNETNQHVDDGVVLAKGTPEHLAATGAALRATVDQLTSQGAQLAFIDVLPPGMSVDCLENGAPDGPACVREVSPESGEAPYNSLFQEIAAESPAVVEITLADVLCPDGACPLVVDGVVMRYDGNHFTATGSRKMAPLLDERLAAAGIRLEALLAGAGTS